MVQHDPYLSENGRYECLACGHRTDESGRCPDCNSHLRNIAVTRE